ncbi:Ank3 [Symbiodinium sp. KB8]|nr:Ank3 [Symbiodinium sp. KB8]
MSDRANYEINFDEVLQGAILLFGVKIGECDMALQLGLPCQVPVPSDPFDEPERGVHNSPTKRPRGTGSGTGVKMPPMGGVTIEAIQELLAQQSATLMEAQRSTISQLEARQNEKIQALDSKIGRQGTVTDNLCQAVRDLESRLSKVEQSKGAIGPGGVQTDPRYRLTLVFGGWGKQTRRHIILHQLSEAIDKLNLKQYIDSAPFTTGPRRSVALCNFHVKEDETPGDTKTRMFAVIQAVNAAKASLQGGDRPLWCSFSRTTEERGKAAVPGFVKKVVLTHRPESKGELDVEYASGMSWMGEHQLSGMGDKPEGDGVAMVETRAGKGWIDVKRLADATGVSSATVQEMVDEHRDLRATARTGKSNQFLNQFAARDLQPVAHSEEQMEVPTSRPRQQDRQGRIIDLIASARVMTKETEVHVNSHKVLGTDHELISTKVVFAGVKGRGRPNTKPRVVTKAIPEILELDQQEMVKLAKEHTGVKPGAGYKDPPSVKALFNMARFSKCADDWKKAFAERRKEKTKHKQNLVEAVAKGEWSGYRKLKSGKTVEWECHFAESQEGDPHKSIHEHLEGIYGNSPPDLTDFQPEGSFEPISPEELQTAIQQGKRGKSVGEDGTSLELVEGIAQAVGGESAILTWFNEILQSGQLPEATSSDLFVLLSFEGKQSIDYVYAIHKLLSLEREWPTSTGDSTIQLNNGIRQGAVESPHFFTNLAEWTLEDTATRYSWPREDPMLRGLGITELMFVDDATLWQSCLRMLSRRVEQWMVVLRESGLRINLGKCQLYCSPSNRQGNKMTVHGTELEGDSHLNIMGVNFAVNQTTTEMLSSLMEVVHDLGREVLDVSRNNQWWHNEQRNPRGERCSVARESSMPQYVARSFVMKVLLLLFHFHVRAQMPKAMVQEMVEEDCIPEPLSGTDGVQTLTSTASTSSNSITRPVGHDSPETEGEEQQNAQRSQDSNNEITGPYENWILMKDHAVAEIEMTLRQLVQVEETETAGEIAWRLHEMLQADRGTELVDRCYVGAAYQAIDVCVRYSLRHRPRGGAQIDEGWMDTVRNLEMGIYQAALARVRNYHRAWEAERQRHERLMRAQPDPEARREHYDRGQSRTPRRSTTDRGAINGEEVEDFTSLVTTSGDTSRTPRRDGRPRYRPRVTESTVWLTPQGAMHEAPQAPPEAEPSSGPSVLPEPSSTDEAVDIWLGLLGFTEEPTDSLPTILPDSLQGIIQDAIASMSPRAVGLMRRSLPTCLNALQDEIMELMRAAATRTRPGAGSGDGECGPRSTGASASGAPSTADRPSRRTEAADRHSRRDERASRSRPPAREASASSDVVEVEVEGEESDSSFWTQVLMRAGQGRRDTGNGRVSPTASLGKDRQSSAEGEQEVDLEDAALVQTGQEGGYGSSSSSSSSGGSGSGSDRDAATINPDADQEVWNRHHGQVEGPAPTICRSAEHVRRQEWWRRATAAILGDQGDGRVTVGVWSRVAQTIKDRDDRCYADFAEVLMRFLGGVLILDDDSVAEPGVHLHMVEDMEKNLWEMFRNGDIGEEEGHERTKWWKINNKPSWQLAHPMGLMAAQWVQGDRYGCRCVKMPDGTVVAVRPESEAVVRADGDAEDADEAEGPEDNTLMQTSLTKLLGQQGRTRVVLQGLNFRLSNMGGSSASTRARELLRRLVEHFRIHMGNRGSLPELVQDAEATLAGHVDQDLEENPVDNEDSEFIRGWWHDLLNALNHDILQAQEEPMMCITDTEKQEIEHGQEEEAEQVRAEEEWQEYETAKRREQQNEQQRLCEEAARYRAWEEWAVWDAMNRPPTRKRRMEIQVLHGGTAGQSSSSCSMARCSLEGWDGVGELRINLRILPGDTTQAQPDGSEDREHESEASTVLVRDEGGHQDGDRREVAPTVADTGEEDGRRGNGGGGANNEANSMQETSTVPVESEGNTLNDMELAAIDAYAEQLKVEYDELERRVQQEAEGQGGPEEMEKFLAEKDQTETVIERKDCSCIDLVLRDIPTAGGKRTLLTLEGPLLPHDKMREQGLLTQWRDGHPRKVVLISHQWAGRRHPDPKGDQMRVLQGVLKDMAAGKLRVGKDTIAESTGTDVPMPSEEEQLNCLDWDIWYDFFGIPQVDDRGCVTHTPELQAAVDSIPAYCNAADFVIVLAPKICHSDTGDTMNYISWATRGVSAWLREPGG